MTWKMLTFLESNSSANKTYLNMHISSIFRRRRRCLIFNWIGNVNVEAYLMLSFVFRNVSSELMLIRLRWKNLLWSRNSKSFKDNFYPTSAFSKPYCLKHSDWHDHENKAWLSCCRTKRNWTLQKIFKFHLLFDNCWKLSLYVNIKAKWTVIKVIQTNKISIVRNNESVNSVVSCLLSLNYLSYCSNSPPSSY